uniref:Uncharacterized protein n=1 Tax=Vitis vinifera TaxID=29760 RepID=A5ASL9_VITVI|nr:hypothetical protein VITISV_019162 [Vitis vinifera]
MHKVILNSLIASYNRDVKVLRTRFTSSHYRTDEGQPSNCHEHVNESGAPFYTNNPQHSPVHSGGQRRSSEDDLGCTNERVLERPNVEDGVFFANEDPFHPGLHNKLVLVQSCMDNNADVAPQASEEIRPRRVKIKVRRHRQRAAACKSPFIQLCVSKYKRLTEEETHVADYVFDESKDPRCHTGMYVILYMQHWDGSGLNRTINFEFTDKLIEEDEFDANQKDAFKLRRYAHYPILHSQNDLNLVDQHVIQHIFDEILVIAF